MIFQESSRVRRVVGRLDKGDDCVDAITEFCREHGITAAEVRGVGQLDRVELVRFREGEGYTPIFEGEGEFDVVQMNGNVAVLGDEPVVRLETVLAAEGPVGAQVVTGQLRAGRVVEMEFVLEVFEDLEIRRKMNPNSGRLDLHAIKDLGASQESDANQAATESDTGANSPSVSSETEKKGGSDEKITGQSMSWEDAAEESEDARDASVPNGESPGSDEPEGDDEDPFGDIDLDAPMLEAGDILKHPKLGDCRVMKVEEDDYAHIRLPRGKIRKLSLDVVDPKFVEEEDDHNVFEAQIQK